MIVILTDHNVPNELDKIKVNCTHHFQHLQLFFDDLMIIDGYKIRSDFNIISVHFCNYLAENFTPIINLIDIYEHTSRYVLLNSDWTAYTSVEGIDCFNRSTDTRPILDLDPIDCCIVFTCTDQKKKKKMREIYYLLFQPCQVKFPCEIKLLSVKIFNHFDDNMKFFNY